MANPDVQAAELASTAPPIGESRWPMAIAVIALMCAAMIAPANLSIMPGWFLATLEGALLAALIVLDPGRIDGTGPWQRQVSIALVVLILISTLGSTARLVFDLRD